MPSFSRLAPIAAVAVTVASGAQAAEAPVAFSCGGESVAITFSDGKAEVMRGGETNYISAALSIYLSLYNLFVNLLQLLMVFAGGSRE